MRAVRIVVASLAVLLLFMATPAGAQSNNASPCAPGGPGNSNNPNNNPQYPPRDCAVAANRTEVAPGGTLTLTGQCPAGTTSVNFRLIPGNADLGSTTPDSNGNYSKVVTIPAGTRAGEYRIEARCEGVLGAGVVRSVAIRVTGAVGAGTLPRTGNASVLPLSGAGVALVALGGLAVVAVRRRREHAAES